MSLIESWDFKPAKRVTTATPIRELQKQEERTFKVSKSNPYDILPPSDSAINSQPYNSEWNFRVALGRSMSSPEMFAAAKSLRSDPTSSFYNVYSKPTNRASSNLEALGVQTDNMDQWVKQNQGFMLNNLIYDGTTNTPTKPGKKASWDQQVAYQMYQYGKSEDQTKAAENELQALQKEINSWTNMAGRNYNDDEIIGKVNNNFASKYPTLNAIKNSDPAQPMEFNRAIDFSDDVMQGMIWEARNPEYDGDIYGAMGYSYLGEGNTYQENKALRDKLNDDRYNEKYAPYTVGSTLEKQRVYFGVDSFDDDWLLDNAWMAESEDSTLRGYYMDVYNAEEFTKKAEEQNAKLKAKLEKKLQSAKDANEVRDKLNTWLADSEFSALAEMDKTVQRRYGLKGTTRAIQFNRNELEQYIDSRCARNAENASTVDFTNDTVGKLTSTPAEPSQDAKDAGTKTIGIKRVDTPEQKPGQETEDNPYAIGGKSVVQPKENKAQGTFSFDLQQQEEKAWQDRIGPVSDVIADYGTKAEQSVFKNGLSLYYDEKTTELANVEADPVAAKNVVDQGVLSEICNTSLDQIRVIADYEKDQATLKDLERERNRAQSQYNQYARRMEATGGANWFDADVINAIIESPEWEEIKSNIQADNSAEQAIGYRRLNTLLFESGISKYEDIFQFFGTGEDGKITGVPEDVQRYADLALKGGVENTSDLEPLTIEEEELMQGFADDVEDLDEQIAEIQDTIAGKEEAYNNAVSAKNGIMTEASDMEDIFGSSVGAEMYNMVGRLYKVSQSYTPGQFTTDDLLDRTISESEGKVTREQIVPQVSGMVTDDINSLKQLEEDLAMAEKLGIPFTDDEKNGIRSAIEGIKKEIKYAGYFLLDDENDFDKIADEAMAKGVTDGMSDLTKANVNAILTGEFSSFLDSTWDSVLNAINPSHGFDDFHKQFFDVAYNKYDSRLQEGRIASILGSMNDTEKKRYFYLLSTSGEDAANEYFRHLVNEQEYGALVDRAAEAEGEKMREMSGGNGGWQALAFYGLSFLTKVYGDVQSAGTWIKGKLTGEDANPNSVGYMFSQATTDMREGTRDYLHSKFGDNEFVDLVFDSLTSAGDSTINAVLTTGGFELLGECVPALGKVMGFLEAASSGKYGGLVKFGANALNDFNHALPMAFSAAISTYREWQTKGASQEQLNAIFTSTLFAEAVSEALTYGNIKGMFEKGATGEIKGFLKELFSNGAEEAFGEGFNQWWEDNAETVIMGEKSRYAELIDYYHNELGLPKSIAEEYAGKEMTKSIAMAAASGFISSSASSTTGYVGGQIKNAPAIAAQNAQNRQKESDAALLSVAGQNPNPTNASMAITAVFSKALGIHEGTAASMSLVDNISNGSVKQATAIARGIVAASGNLTMAAKQALSYATLTDGNGNRTLQDIAQKAKNGEKISEQDVQDLITAVQEDQNGENAETYAAEKESAIKENRFAKKVMEILGQPETAKKIKDAEKAADNATRVAADAREQLERKQDEFEAAQQQAVSAGEAVQQDPGSGENDIKAATSKVTNAATMLDQQEQVVEKTEAERQDAVENQQTVANDELTKARNEAEPAVEQEMQQEAVEQQQRLEQQRIDEENRIQAEAQAREQNNLAFTDTEAFLDQYYPDATEEDRAKVLDRVNEIRREMSGEAMLDRGRFAQQVAKKFGLKINLIDTTHGGKVALQEGFVNPNTGEITMDLTSTQDDIMYKVLGHEMLHVARTSETYDELADTLLRMEYGDDYNMEGSRFQTDTRLKQEHYNQYLKLMHEQDNSIPLQEISADSAKEEIVADLMGKIFRGDDGKANFDLINRLAAEKPSVARRFLDAIKSFLKKMVGIEGAPLTQAQQVVDLLETALNEAKEVRKENTETGDKKYYLGKTEDGRMFVNVNTEQDVFDGLSPEQILRKAESIIKGKFKNLTVGFADGDATVTKRTAEEYARPTNRRLSSDIKEAKGRASTELDNLLYASELLSPDDPDYPTTVYSKDHHPNVRRWSYYRTLFKVNGEQFKGIINVARMDNFARVHDITHIEKDGSWSALQENNPQGASAIISDETVTQGNPNVNTLVTDDQGNALAGEIDGTTEIKYSLSSWTQEEKDRVRSDLLKKGFSEQDADKWISDVNGIASIIASDPARLDFMADPEKTMLKPNAEYVKTLDASTLCAKRLLYQGTFDAIQHMLPNTPLMPEDLIDLANMMREMGYETPCGICYVESRRRQLGKFTEQWLESYDGEYKPTIDEVTTSDGLESLRANHPQAYQDFINAMNKKGTMNPKVVQLRTDYRGEISKMTPGQIQKVKDIGGLRVQSFSDFETPHLLDMAQAVMDMSSKGLTAQAYTKVPNFPWAFGDTGIKINLSLIGKGTGIDENGNLVFDDVEGMPFEEALKLRNRYSENVGTILVGINDDHIKAAMADPRIDFIIPFHKSGWSSKELEKMSVLNEYSDYTDSQNEKAITGKTKDGKYKTESLEKSKRVNFQPVGENGYWDFSKTGKENAETYLEMCAKDKRLPKFSQFLVDNGDGSFSLQPDGSTDGYWKTLIDFKMYDNEGNGAPQREVTPDINMNEAVRILNEYSLDRNGISRQDNNSLPVAQPVVERYVEEYKQNHPLGEERVKYSLPSDAAYMSAVEHGEMDEAQRMVDEKADESGYTDKAYHGTDRFGFTVFDMAKSQNEIFVSYNRNVAGTYADAGDWIRKISEKGVDEDFYSMSSQEIVDYLNNMDEKTKALFKSAGMGFKDASLEDDGWIAIHIDDETDASYERHDLADQLMTRFSNDLGSGVYDLYTRPGKQLVIECDGHSWSDIPWALVIEADPEAQGEHPEMYGAKTRQISKWAREHGYDSVRINGIYDDGGVSYDYGQAYGDIGIFFNQDDVKSADTVTYDDNGNVIPLSERFQTNEPDIRYSLPSDHLLDQQIRGFLNGSNTNLSTNTESGPQRQFGSKTAQESDALHQEVKDYLFNNSTYTPDTNSAQIDRAMDWVQRKATTDDPDGYRAALNEVTSENFDYRSADGQARMLTVMGMAALKAQNGTPAERQAALQDELQLADAYNKQGTDLGRQLQARKIFRLMTPIGRQSVLKKMADQINDQYAKEGKTTRIGLSDWTLMAAANAQDEADFQKVQKAAAKELAEQIPANWKDKLRGWRMLSMLGNPRTHIRNIVGNALFVPVVSMKNKVGAAIEIASRRKERTKTLSPFVSKSIREFAKQDAKTLKDTLTGEAKYNEDNAVQKEMKPFKGMLQAIIDLNGNALEAEDWIFLKGHYQRALGGWMQANGYTPEQLQSNPSLLEKGRTYAVQEAQKATYRDFNKLAATLNKVSRDGGIAGFLVDATLPFKKTPANILRRGMEYSPAGLMRSLTTDLYHLKQWNDAQNGKLKAMPEKALSPNQFIDRLASGLSGSAIMAIGALLSSMGIVTCGLDDDDDKLEKEKGNQEYAFKFSIGGKDYTFTMDWAAPMSMPFFVGAAIQEQLSQQDGFDVEELVDAFGNITEPVFNLSMLDGVSSLFKTSQYDDTNTITQIGAKVASNYATSYVPSLLGAIARTVDENRRKSYVESGKGTGVLGTFRYAREQTENKIPGLSQTNIPYRNVWGEAETSGLAERILENFILPGYVNEYRNDPVLNEMGRLYDATGDANMIPEDPGKTITYKKQKYVLDAAQWDTYKETRGQAAYQLLNDLIGTESYANANATTQTQMISDAWSYADKMGKAAVIPDFEYEKLGDDPAGAIAKESTITVDKAEMIKALNAEDQEAYDAMVEALHENNVEDSEIKTKIGNTYRDQYKDAYRKGDYERMAEIENILDMTGFDFNLGNWEDAVDKENE